MGWLILAYLGLEGLGVFVFLVFDFLFGIAFLSLLFALFLLFCCWIVLGVGSCFVFSFSLFFCCFCFFVFVFWRV